MELFDCIVVGGGASGMMAAGRAGERSLKVLLLEKNKKLGVKLSISGGGRCNITNAEDDVRKLLSHYGDAEDLLYSSFAKFGVKNTFDFFEGKRELPLKVEDRKRAFPKSERAGDVVYALSKFIKDNNVLVKLGTKVSGVKLNEEKRFVVQTSDGAYEGKSLILSTGGFSHPETGSTGDGFNWLKDLNHKVHNPTPTIVPLAVSDKWIKDISGVTFENIKITFFVDGKKSFNKKGNLLCTHFGISGPMILNSAKEVSDLMHTGLVTFIIDLYPAMDQGILEQHLVKVFDQNKNKILKNVLGEVIPKASVKVLLDLVPHIDPETKVHSVTKAMRKDLAILLKTLPGTVTGLMDFDRAVVADGGLDLTEVDTKTFESKKIKNLYIIGDLLHINRPSGGYSLQLCWTSGYIAGSNA